MSDHTISLELTRDSVCAGDDIDAPHLTNLDLSANTTTMALAAQIQSSRYLANIAGGQATCVMEVDGTPVAVIAQQWEKPAILDAHLDLSRASSVHIRYMAQSNPALVSETIQAHKLRGNA